MRAAAYGLLFLVLVPPAACSQPVESRHTRAPDLVEVARLDSTIHLDIRYATVRNFMHRKMYAEARAFLQRPAAEALVRANRKLHAAGYGIVVFDAYRPWAVTKQFWDETPKAKRNFVANPRKGSKHNRGCAADVSLYDCATGGEVEMPSAFDEFSARASADYPGGTTRQRRMRAMLREAMEAEGFAVESNEWWHFDYRAWRDYGILNIPFDRIGLSRTR